MSSIVSFCRGLSLNLISTLYQAWKLKLIEVHTPSPLQTIYTQRMIGLDSDVLHDLVPFVQLKKRENAHGGVLLLVKLQAKKPASLPKVRLLYG